MVSFAILGCGRIGRMHARNIKAHPRAELVAVYDVVAQGRRATRRPNSAPRSLGSRR